MTAPVTVRVHESARPWRRQRWHFTATAGNGRILCHSELYANHADCVAAAHLAFGAETAAVLEGDGPVYYLRVGAQ